MENNRKKKPKSRCVLARRSRCLLTTRHDPYFLTDDEEEEEVDSDQEASDEEDSDQVDASSSSGNSIIHEKDNGADKEEEEEAEDDNDDGSSSEPPLPRRNGGAAAEEWWQILRATAQAQGIPMEYILQQIQQQIHSDGDDTDDDDEDDETATDLPPRPTCLKDVATYIQSNHCRRILVLAGAGMSVISGIPDFRSANGLYQTIPVDNLSNLTDEQRDHIRHDPSYALDQYLFDVNPLVCLELQRDFILGVRDRRWKATLAHRFVELLYTKFATSGDAANDASDAANANSNGPQPSPSSSSSSNNNTNNNGGKLVRLYTQNIDGLEEQCGNLPRDKVIAVHGSMDRAECAQCGTMMDYHQFCHSVEHQIKDLRHPDAAHQSSQPILCEQCGRPTVKPGIVLFRSRLPRTFFDHVPIDTKHVDLLIIIGTSLRVAPANTIVHRVPKRCVRILINRDVEGTHLGLNFDLDDTGTTTTTTARSSSSSRDYFAQGEIDDVILVLAGHLGWWDDLAAYLEDEQLPASSAAQLRARLQQQQSQRPPGREKADETTTTTTTATTTGGTA
jgi:NAD+-dependent protein deacetylase sirtuin 2